MSTTPDTTAAETASAGQHQILPHVVAAIGNTPLIRLDRLNRGCRTPLIGKLESTNPGGSVKDRIGIRMIEEAERRGWLKPGGTIVEPTSGNTGVGLAMAAAVRGFRCVFVMPDKVSTEKRALLRAYGAEVVTTPTNVARDAAESYYSVADRLTREIPGAFQPNQYFNPMNPRTHYEATGPEIWHGTGGQVTHFVAGVGTGGTISGISRYLKQQNGNVQVIGADPEGSIYTTPTPHPYMVEGVGEDFWPGTFDRSLVDAFVSVSDRDAFATARRMTREEGILLGDSGGLAVAAALQVARRLDDPQAMVVVLLPDSGRSYLSRLYNDEWMRENGFLPRINTATRAAELLARTQRQRSQPGDSAQPTVVVRADATVAHALALLQERGISHLPVIGSGNGSAGDADNPITVDAIVGSVQERALLDRIVRAPATLHATVASVMDAPFPLVDAAAEVEHIFPLLANAGASAVLVQRVGALLGILTRADLLDFVSHIRRDP